MISLMPVYRDSTLDDLSREGLMRLLCRSFENMGGFLSATHRLVVSDDDDVLGLANQMELTALRAPAPSGRLLPFPGSGVVEWLQDLLPEMEMPVVMIEYRNPALTPEVLESFAAEHVSHPDLPLVSVRECVDHPCQLFHARSLVGAGVLIVCHRDADGRYISRFLPSEFKQSFELESDGFWDLLVEPGGVRLVAGARITENVHAGAAHVLIALGGEKYPHFSLSVDNGEARFLTLPHESTEWTNLSLHFSDKKIHLGNNPSAFLIAEDVGSFIDDIVGGHFVITNEIDHGYADDKIPYQPVGASWESNGNLLINKDTGLVIGGRQAFPLVYEEDASLVAFTPHADGSGFSFDQVSCYPLKDSQSLIISTEFDALRYDVNYELGVA